MSANYVVWAQKDIDNACALKRLVGVAEQYRLTDGTPLVKEFPKEAHFEMDPDYPHDTLLVDNVQNTDLVIVGSRRLKEFLDKAKVKSVEFLPVAIRDHKGKTASRDYFIIHPIDLVDCLQVKKCGVEWSEIVEDTIDSVERLVIDEGKVDHDRRLFRMNFFHDVVLARRDLAEAIDAEGFQGVRWIELSKYPEG